MVATERAYNRATRRAERWLRETGEEFRHARISAGLSQQEVADRVRISRSVYSRIERGKLRHLSIVLATRIAMVLGLDLVVRAYPGGLSIRDAAHAERLKRVLSRVEPPLSYRIEVPLPQREGSPEQRAWDSMIFGRGQQTAVELEMRLYDVQAQTRGRAPAERVRPGLTAGGSLCARAAPSGARTKTRFPTTGSCLSLSSAATRPRAS